MARAILVKVKETFTYNVDEREITIKKGSEVTVGSEKGDDIFFFGGGWGYLPKKHFDLDNILRVIAKG